jgi:Na+-transporting NADH:ubiquinone oxidoreductase subunit A
LTVRGGYNVPVDGAPSVEVRDLTVPERLYLPLTTPHFRFDELLVAEGQPVARGDRLAIDSERFSVPLLSPVDGAVRLGETTGHVILEVRGGTRSHDGDAANGAGESSRKASGQFSGSERGAPGVLLRLGAWQFFVDARTREPVDPSESPDAIIATTLRLEPFLAGGEAQLEGGLGRLKGGLSCLRAIFPEASLYVVAPSADEPLAADVRAAASACDGAHLVAVPMRYPFDDPALLAMLLHLPSGDESNVWALPVEGLLAVEAALARGEPAVERVISLAGPAVIEPMHLRVVPGYPISRLLEGRLLEGEVRAVNGGILTGNTIPPEQKGLDSECAGITVLHEPDTQKLLAFSMPGVDRRSYSRTFVGTLRTDMAMRFTTGLSGEPRPCINCGLCTDVCPAGILPAAIHKKLYAGKIEEVQRLRVDLCVGCGLCSFVCPSKIELRRELLNAAAALREEAALVRAELKAAAEQSEAGEAEGAP